MGNNYIAIEIGGTKLQIVSGDDSCTINERLRFKIVKENGADGIKKQIEEGLLILQKKSNHSAVGIGFGGPLDWKTGKISVSFQVEGWKNFDLVNWLKSKSNIPVFIENDANVAALGEAIHGAGQNFSNIFYITLGSGVGGGLVKDGQIYHGAKPGEAEIGHVRLDRSGTILQSRCSGWAVDMKIREAVLKEPDSVLAQLTKDAVSGEARFLLPAIEQGDTLAKKILQETCDDIAFGLSHVVHLFHPEVIILGGGLSLIGEPLRALVESQIQSYIMDLFLPGPHIFLSSLKEDAVPVGALELARKHLNLIW